tara:strand:- start:1339 stop:1527 length:189 start_codon:yes stop_codon:yes gene_type:complete
MFLWFCGLLAYIYITDGLTNFLVTGSVFAIFGVVVAVQVRRGKWFQIHDKDKSTTRTNEKNV